MRPRTRSLALVGVLLAAGCATPGLLNQPASDTTVQAFVRWPGAGTRATPTPVPTPTPVTPAPATPTPAAPTPATPAGGTNDTVVYSTGQFLGANGDTDRWAFSLRALQRPDGHLEDGQVIVTSSIAGRNATLFGDIKTGTITKTPGAGGTADLTATLTTGGTMHLVLTDGNDAATMDRFKFDSGNWHGDGTVYHGCVRILRTRPLSAGTAPASGYTFDPRIGLFIVAADAAAEHQRPDDLCDARVVEVTRPDPLIDFRKNDPGGLIHAPGSDNNVP